MSPLPAPAAVRSIAARGAAQRESLTARAFGRLPREPHPGMGVPASASRPALGEAPGCGSCGERLPRGSAPAAEAAEKPSVCPLIARKRRDSVALRAGKGGQSVSRCPRRLPPPGQRQPGAAQGMPPPSFLLALPAGHGHPGAHPSC